MPEEGIAIASGGNAAIAAAWAGREAGIKVTVFLPATAPAVKIARLRALGADVRFEGTVYAHALEASIQHAEATGALLSHAYDNPLIAAGAGTCAAEIRDQVPDVDTVMVAVGGGGLFSGTAAALFPHGVRVVAVEPENCRALNAALEAGGPTDVDVDSVAADSLGARRVSETAYRLATQLGWRHPSWSPTSRSSRPAPRCGSTAECWWSTAPQRRWRPCTSGQYRPQRRRTDRLSCSAARTPIRPTCLTELPLNSLNRR